jgi:anhydro-N-acetylmuramic acid kinase
MSIARWFIGLASGSGGEGADAVLVETTGIGLQLTSRVLQVLRRQHPRDVQEAFLKTMLSGAPGSFGELASLHRQLGESAAAAVVQLTTPLRAEMARVLSIGHIGPLAWHDPAGRNAASIEIGQSSAIVERTGLTVFSEFRERDVAAGGQGMPITAIADWVQFRNPEQPRILIHLGGTTSLVCLPAHAKPQDVIAFEIGPGTRLLDSVIRQASHGRERYDAGGKYSVQGHCLDALLASWLEHSFFQQKPPKSLGRSEFGAEWIARAARSVAAAGGTLEDYLCTLSHFLIRSVVIACKRWLPNMDGPPHYWLSGGGSRNGLFWRLLEQEIPGVQLHRLDEIGVASQARQAASAAVLAAMAMDGIPASSPGATGAVGRLLGRVTPGEPKNWARCLRWMSEQSALDMTHPNRAA